VVFLTFKVVNFYFNLTAKMKFRKERREDKGKTEKEERTTRMEG